MRSSLLRTGMLALASSLVVGCAGGLVADETDAGAGDASPPPSDAHSDGPIHLDANDPCGNGVKDGTETDVDCGGSSCPKCGNGFHCGSVADCKIPICTGGVCGACNGTTVCPIGQSCVAGFCRACTTESDCNGQVCNSGTCEACKLTSQCGAGEVCNYGTCTGGNQVPMYTCPGIVSLGGGAWGFYGCQNQLTSAPTCYEIEAPTTQTFNCTAVGKLMVAAAPPAAPPGGKSVPMYQCPGAVSLGGGAWGFYGCQSQLTNTTTCLEIEAPTQQTFACPAAGHITLEP